MKYPSCIVSRTYHKGKVLNKEIIYKAINNVVQKYKKADNRIRTIHADNEFRSIMTGLIDTCAIKNLISLTQGIMFRTLNLRPAYSRRCSGSLSTDCYLNDCPGQSFDSNNLAKFLFFFVFWIVLKLGLPQFCNPSSTFPD